MEVLGEYFNMDFLNYTINAAFPIELFSLENTLDLVENYGSLAKDGYNEIYTLYTRQDTIDPKSRRACQIGNETPQLLSNGKLLILNVFPSNKIYNAVINGDLEDVEIISHEQLEEYLLNNPVVTQS